MCRAVAHQCQLVPLSRASRGCCREDGVGPRSLSDDGMESGDLTTLKFWNHGSCAGEVSFSAVIYEPHRMAHDYFRAVIDI